MPGTSRGRLLLVDDDLVMLSTLNAILQDHFDLRVATGVRAALAALAQHEFDVLVTDYSMRDGTGADLLAAVQASHSGIYTIVLTGRSGWAEVRQLQRDGVLVLFKPVDPEELCGWVRNGVAMNQLGAASRRLRAQIDDRARGEQP